MTNYRDDTCWVYVQRDDEGNYIIAITYDEEFSQRKEFNGRPLLLWRKFEDTLFAAGYRIALKTLSKESLQEALKRYKEADKKHDATN